MPPRRVLNPCHSHLLTDFRSRHAGNLQQIHAVSQHRGNRSSESQFLRRRGILAQRTQASRHPRRRLAAIAHEARLLEQVID